MHMANMLAQQEIRTARHGQQNFIDRAAAAKQEDNLLANFLQAHRLTRPGGFMLIAFGEHYFSEKAIAGWITRSPSQRSDLVARQVATAVIAIVLRDGCI